MNDSLDTSPPKKDKEFIRLWSINLPDVLARENVKQGHLIHLEILCDMYVESKKLTDDISFNGYVYDTGEGRNGQQSKIRPEVLQLNKLRSEIRAFSQMLGLTLVKDTLKTKGTSEKEEKW